MRKLAFVAAGAMIVSVPSLAQEMEDVRDVAETPLEDIGLSKEELAQVLLEAAQDPYSNRGLDTCNSLVAEIARLDTVLGNDYDLAGKEKTGVSGKSVAKGVVGSIIPFRSIVREVSGAAGDKRKADAAVRAGLARRAYLKGLGQGRDCSYPARPKGT
ncbi:MAG: hypothetical protein AAFP79_13380 [Pseudomonadota bacterium]